MAEEKGVSLGVAPFEFRNASPDTMKVMRLVGKTTQVAGIFGGEIIAVRPETQEWGVQVIPLMDKETGAGRVYIRVESSDPQGGDRPGVTVRI
ncbi:hypothetical protein A2160_05040 [Candidatus Beckwithbacteria bacterium RBG_13_42_9]|uniref:Uncharacterized protein n=1 Tax=Candidatus Beckwithbacteria bacterium RBG_13_42_9 TaxID=1797457 RepID=A0A1F5E808_9BACT|nr:MAG: hypothetical protein A2160_05040 [Candidatus Beckwithbacteria bacterium RBG_13_42_9]